MTVASKVHILGAGSIGGLVAVELSSHAAKPEIVLLLRNAAKAHHFETINKSTIFVKRLFKTPNERISAQFKALSTQDIKETIENLIVTTKTYQTKSALEPYLPFIKPTTNILLIQNGLGVVQELYKDVWPIVESRPNVYQGVINSGAFISANTGDEFEISHAGYAPLYIGKLPKDFTNYTKDEEYVRPLFIQQLADSKGLNTVVLPYSDLLVSQISKFMVNACINSNTSIIDCVNGELNGVDRVRDLFYSIISESVDIFYKVFPILKTKKDIEKKLNKQDLLDNVVHYGIVVNSQNSSSMRQDVLNLRDTEIDYINGFVVKAAEEIGEKAFVNQTITNLVKLRLSLSRKRAESNK